MSGIGFGSDFIDATAKAYDLGKIIYSDIKNYKEAKDKKEVKKQLEDLRDHIGEIDSQLSRLHSKLTLDKDKTDYQKNVDDFGRMYSRIQSIGISIMMISQLPYFHKFPILRDILNMKIGSEAVDADKIDKEVYWKDYDTFEQFIARMRQTTRTALTAMNVHIESYFS